MSKEEKRAKDRAYYAANKDKILAYQKSYYVNNKEQILAYQDFYNENNKEKVASRKKSYSKANEKKVAAYQQEYSKENKEKLSAYNKNYRQSNKEKLRAASNSYAKNRKAVDPIFSMRLRIKDAINNSLSKKGFTKKSRTHEILGCDWETFKEHIESRFLDGMSWENRDEWHIDHIIPVSLAQDEEAVITLNHYLNLRPLWAADNLEKSDKMPSMDLIKQYGADVIFNKLKGI